MCKIAIIPTVTDSTTEKAWEFSMAIEPYMTRHDDDGFGYMALSKEGLFGERWLKVKQAFDFRPKHFKGENTAFLPFSSIIDAAPSYNSFGKLTEKALSICLHSRKATCGVSMANVHPFVTHDLSYGVIHNGMISNHAQFKKSYSTCDSEAVLSQLVAHDTANNFKGLIDVTNSLYGWYAFAAYSKNAQGLWSLDIVKDETSSLFASYIPMLNTIVFATEGEMIKKACDDLKWDYGAIYPVKGDTALRYDPIRDIQIDAMPIDSNGYNLSSYADDWTNYRELDTQSKLSQVGLDDDGRYLAETHGVDSNYDDSRWGQDAYDYINQTIVRSEKKRK
jgi:predicted glutamine amidotransferase